MGTLSQMINPVLVSLGAGGVHEGGMVRGGWLRGEHSHYKGQRQTVMLLRQPRKPSFLALCLHSASVVRKIGKQWERKKKGKSKGSSHLTKQARGKKK